MAHSLHSKNSIQKKIRIEIKLIKKILVGSQLSYFKFRLISIVYSYNRLFVYVPICYLYKGIPRINSPLLLDKPQLLNQLKFTIYSSSAYPRLAIHLAREILTSFLNQSQSVLFLYHPRSFQQESNSFRSFSDNQ